MWLYRSNQSTGDKPGSTNIWLSTDMTWCRIGGESSPASEVLPFHGSKPRLADLGDSIAYANWPYAKYLRLETCIANIIAPIIS